MKILAISDKVIDNVHSPTIGEEFGDVDLVIARGDLPFHIWSISLLPWVYLAFLSTATTTSTFK